MRNSMPGPRDHALSPRPTEPPPPRRLLFIISDTSAGPVDRHPVLWARACRVCRAPLGPAGGLAVVGWPGWLHPTQAVPHAPGLVLMVEAEACRGGGGAARLRGLPAPSTCPPLPCALQAWATTGSVPGQGWAPAPPPRGRSHRSPCKQGWGTSTLFHAPRCGVQPLRRGEPSGACVGAGRHRIRSWGKKPAC